MTKLTKQYIQDYIKDKKIDTTKPFELRLSFNQITSIKKNAFDGLNNLERLYLNNNKITSIEKGTFDSLGKLEWLDLSNNKITSIKGVFDSLNNLERLYLDNNKITSIEKEYYISRTEILELIKQINSLDSEVKIKKTKIIQ